MTHFVMFDTETDLGKGLTGAEEAGGSQNLKNGPFGGVNQQINFLDADLASVDRSITRSSFACVFPAPVVSHLYYSRSLDRCGWPSPVVHRRYQLHRMPDRVRAFIQQVWCRLSSLW